LECNGDFRVTPEDIAYCIFTSGSTGLPKGAVLHHKNVINLVHGLHSLIYCKYVAPINIALIANPIFDASVQQIFAALALGHKLTIVPEALRLQPEALVDYLNEQNINVFDCTPTLLNIMVNQETVAELTADYCLVGGEALPPDLVKRFYAQNPHTQLVNLYGPTECCVDASAFIVPRADKDQNRSTATAIGKPLPGVSIRVCDSDFNDMPISVPGEIVISGAGVGSGYLNREALTRDVFTPSGYRTGDIGFWDTEGNLHFVGRRDHQVKVRGYRIETGEIEQILVSHPAIQEAVCQVIDDELEAFFTSEVTILPDELRDHCLTRLPTYMVPHHFYQVDAIPKTASYKIDRRALQKKKSLQAMDSHSNHTHAITTQRPEFHSLQQQVLYDTWSAVLKTDAFSLDDRFFNLGGDSIKALQVASRLKSQGWIMAVKALFDHQSIRELAPHIQEISSKRNDRHASSRMITQVPVSGIQYWFLNHHSEGNQRLQNHYNQSVLLKPEAPISIAQLESALTVLVSHHSALRSSFQVKENEWFQTLNEPSSIKVSDICKVVQIKSATDLTQHASQYQSSFSIQSAPLIKVVLFNITNGDTADIVEQRLLLVAHHLIVDAVSWRIIISDLAELITEPATSITKPISEAMVESCSFLHWLASVQQSARQKPCVFWQSIIAQLAEMDFTAPFTALADQYQVAIPPQTDKIAPQRIIQKQNLDPELTDRLLTNANQSYNTSTEELLATAFLITLGDFGIDPWLLMEGHGRETGLLNTSDQHEPALDLSRAVGWFTSLYPVCFKRENSFELEHSLKTENSLGQKTDYDRYIKIVKETLRSIPEKGAGFSHQFYRPASNQDGVPLPSLPLVAFNYLGEFGTEFGANLFKLADESTGANHAPLANHTRSKNYTGPCLDLVLLIRNNVLEWELQGDSRYLNQAMLIAISTSLNDRINAIIAHTTAQKEEVLTPSDIDFDGFDVDQLDAFLEKITE
ncbi:MAG: AMP-binding protein, partial [Pseudomonadales bacterium]|nr:AMP-binding protein [Pseudomonadales bacterium]